MGQKLKIAYCGYDFFYHCLDFLTSNDYEVLKVFTFETDDKYNFNCNVLKISEEHNISVQKTKITPDNIAELKELGCNLIIVAGYPYKIPVEDNIFGINIHPTLLPEGRGIWPLPYVILKDKKNSGVTIHKLTSKLDAGDILIQQEFELFDEEDLETLSIKSQMCAVKTLSKLLENFYFFWDNAKVQIGGSIWEMPSEADMLLDWNYDVKTLKKISRAFGYMDSCAIFDGEHWLVQDLNGWEEKHSYPLGAIVHRTNKELLVAVKDGFICLKSYKKDPDYE